MALHDLPRKLTYEDYALIPEDGQRHEIIDGEHYVSPAPFVRHQDLLVELHDSPGRVRQGSPPGKAPRRTHRRPPLGP